MIKITKFIKNIKFKNITGKNAELIKYKADILSKAMIKMQQWS